jgi:hypothetical protein
MTWRWRHDGEDLVPVVHLEHRPAVVDADSVHGRVHSAEAFHGGRHGVTAHARRGQVGSDGQMVPRGDGRKAGHDILGPPALASMTATWASCPANALAIWCPRPPAPATTTLVPDRPRPADAGGEIIDGVEDQHLAQDLLARCDIREQVDELPIVGGVADDIGVREVRSPHHSFRGAGDEVGGQCDRIAERRPLA